MEDQPALEESTKPPCDGIITKAAGAEALLCARADGAADSDPSSSSGGSCKGPVPSPFSISVLSAQGLQELQGIQILNRHQGETEGPQEQQVPKDPCIDKLSLCAPGRSNGMEGKDEDCVVEVESGGVRTPEASSRCADTDIETACRETFLFANAKAGMDMTEDEKAKIAAKIFELSKNSPFFVNEMRCARSKKHKT
ncbi:uncharacterized protein EMH_0005130 [Eimeria mitis]|uniref:Uncharacterized protein n=1 Tax=Eimeria mitis TaxID=44415 RepID=U6KFN1_9EIME|nr:uncharacterized protein EMH_0005130 [Eimeria mitis]CDJ35591.1 hypothetical protein EMH_0005130 [Eimeria mitis]